MLPDYIDPDAWAGFVAMRRAMKAHPWTPRAELLILRNLAEMHTKGHDVNAALDQSTLCGWRGVWPAKGWSVPSAHETPERYAKRVAAEAAADRARMAAPSPEVRERLAKLAGKLRRVA